MSHAFLAEFWLWGLAFLLAMMVLLDGYDLGVGILCLFEPDESRRELMIASIEGTWHSNQTWLVILGGALFGAFPLAYGMLLSTLYLPCVLLLLSLVARGVGIDWYSHARREDRRFWSALFGIGSLAIALVEGAMLGAVMQGLPINSHREFLTPFAWAGPGALLGALSMVCLTGALGAGWAFTYSSGFRQFRPAMLFALGSVVFQAWLAATLPVTGAWPLVLAAFSACFAALCVTAMDRERPFFPLAAGHALTGLVAWLLALRPSFVEPGLTPLSASAGPEPLRAMTVVFGIMLPVIIGYSIYQFMVFRNYGIRQHRHPGH